jgi:hypothetical protein
MEPDGGVTNIRNVSSKHWARWLGLEHRCVVPFTSVSEFNKAAGGNVWFAFDESRLVAVRLRSLTDCSSSVSGGIQASRALAPRAVGRLSNSPPAKIVP